MGQFKPKLDFTHLYKYIHMRVQKNTAGRNLNKHAGLINVDLKIVWYVEKK